MALDISRYTLTPDIAGSIGRGAEAASRMQQAKASKLLAEKAAREEGAQIEALQFAEKIGSGQEQFTDANIAKIFLNNPAAGKGLFEGIGANDKFKREDAVRRAFVLSQTPSENREKVIRSQIEEVQSRGGSPVDTESLLGLPKEQQDVALKSIMMAGLPASELAKIASGQSFGSSSLKIFEPKVDPETGELKVPIINPRTGEVTTKVVPGLTQETPSQRTQREVDQSLQERENALLAEERQAISKSIVAGAQSARRELPKLDRLQKVINASSQGAFAKAKVLFGPLAKELGMEEFDPTNEQAALAAINEYVLNITSQLKGAISDRELDFAERTVARLGNTPEANKLIINRLRSVLSAQIEESNQIKKFKSKGGNPEDFVFNAYFSNSLGRDVSEDEIFETLKAKPELTRDELFITLQITDISSTGE